MTRRKVNTLSLKSLVWGNTNRVVSNRVVSKGPLYPSKNKIIIFCVFCWAKHPSTQQLPIHISGAGLPPDSQIWLLGATPFDTTPFILLRGITITIITTIIIIATTNYYHYYHYYYYGYYHYY